MRMITALSLPNPKQIRQIMIYRTLSEIIFEIYLYFEQEMEGDIASNSIQTCVSFPLRL